MNIASIVAEMIPLRTYGPEFNRAAAENIRVATQPNRPPGWRARFLARALCNAGLIAPEGVDAETQRLAKDGDIGRLPEFLPPTP